MSKLLNRREHNGEQKVALSFVLPLSGEFLQSSKIGQSDCVKAIVLFFSNGGHPDNCSFSCDASLGWL